MGEVFLCAAAELGSLDDIQSVVTLHAPEDGGYKVQEFKPNSDELRAFLSKFSKVVTWGGVGHALKYIGATKEEIEQMIDMQFNIVCNKGFRIALSKVVVVSSDLSREMLNTELDMQRDFAYDDIAEELHMANTDILRYCVKKLITMFQVYKSSTALGVIRWKTRNGREATWTLPVVTVDKNRVIQFNTIGDALAASKDPPSSIDNPIDAKKLVEWYQDK